MRKRRKQELIAGRKIELLLPEKYDNRMTYPVVWLLDGDTIFQILDQIPEEQKIYNFIIAGIPASDRVSEYTPWPAKALNKRFPDFGGTGAEHLGYLISQIMPPMCEKYHCVSTPCGNAIMGYSLGGLLSAYSLFVTEVFGRILSMSGSFWYDGWTQYITQAPLINHSAHVYISSGEKEGGHAQDIKRNAAPATEQTFQFLKNSLPDSRVYLEWNPYGHHDHMILKIQRALSYLNHEFSQN